jgi:uncharacterized protein
MNGERNVLGDPLAPCGTDPMTGVRRDGYCTSGHRSPATHTVCAIVSAEFLAHQRLNGNDLTTPRPEFRFPGLQPGDRWCVAAARWLESARAGFAAPVLLASTHERALEAVPLDLLLANSVDVPADPGPLFDGQD